MEEVHACLHALNKMKMRIFLMFRIFQVSESMNSQSCPRVKCFPWIRLEPLTRPAIADINSDPT